jgi:transposase
VRRASLWRALLGVENTVIEDVEYDETDETDEVVVAHVRPRRAGRGRCGACGARAPWYDRGEGRRRWRGLDLGATRVFLEADARRVNCPVHGPTVQQVPWARHGAGHTYGFDQQVAWLAIQCSKTAVTQLARIAWRTVGAIITRVWDDTTAGLDLFDGLRRIGIDEISYKRNYKYLTVVVDHDTGRLVWVAAGRDQATLRGFFDALGPERCALLTHVSADGANWIGDVVAERCRTRSAAPTRSTSSGGPPTRWTRSAEKRGTPPATTSAHAGHVARPDYGWRPPDTRKR